MEDVGRMFGFGNPELAENQEMEEISYGDKLKSSCGGMCCGLVLFFGCLGLSGWNEYRNVANIQTIKAARESFKQASCSPILDYLEGELVHVTCPISNLQVLGNNDPVLLGIPEESRKGLTLSSYMEAYQWSENARTETKENKVGGGNTKVTTYTYSRRWSSATPSTNTSFHKQGVTCQSQNGNMPCYNWNPEIVEPWWHQAGYDLGWDQIDASKNVKAGDYLLPDSILSGLGNSTTLTPACASAPATPGSLVPTTLAPGAVTSNNTGTAPPTTSAPGTVTSSNSGTVPPTASATGAATASNSAGRKLQQSSGNAQSCIPGGGALKGNKLTWSQKDSNGAMVDYLTRSYTIRKADTVSILAQQKGNAFVPWTSPYDEDYGVFSFSDRNLTAIQMLDEKAAANTGITWFLRFLTLVLVITGLVMVTAPLTQIPDIIPIAGPFLGDLIGWILWAVDCLFGCCCWSVVVALCWIAYRPVVAIPLLVVAVLLCGAGGYVAYQQNQKKSGDKAEEDGKEEDVVEEEIVVPEEKV